MQAMKIFGASAVLALGIGTAQAGPCTEQISNMTKVLSSKDAGSGPTSGAASPSGQAGAHAPTAAMSKQTEGIATSPGDVRRQTAGKPTASASADKDTSEASMALQRAREFDRQGKEADCMNSIGVAKRLSGSK